MGVDGKIGRGSGGLTTTLSQYNGRVYRKVFWEGEGGWCFDDVRGIRGGLIKQRRRSGFIGGGLSGLILCCFLSQPEGPKQGA